MAKPRHSARTKTAARAKSPPADKRSRETALTIAQLALDKKAVEVVVLDVHGLSSYADFFVVMTAESDPQLNAIADHIEQKMKERGERPLGIEGTHAGRWVLLDFGDVVAHVFFPDTRCFYDIEGLWADAPRVRIEG
jgi:ribosome-associated protein